MHLRSVLIAERPREKYLMLLPAHDQQYPLIRMPQYRDTVCGTIQVTKPRFLGNSLIYCLLIWLCFLLQIFLAQVKSKCLSLHKHAYNCVCQWELRKWGVRKGGLEDVNEV